MNELKRIVGKGKFFLYWFQSNSKYSKSLIHVNVHSNHIKGSQNNKEDSK